MNTFLDFLWAMIVIYFWFMIIWMFIRVFADIFRRNDLTGVWKAIWIVVLILVPFLGALIYIISRPVTEQDREMAEEMEQQQKRAAGYSAADEITKLTGLKESGAISDEEFEAAKAKALA
jgi:ABC-type multidrug transport system fused ATPase/permease subunit